jgi:death-on-curing protein
MKQLRDGVGDADETAQTCVQLAAELPFATVSRAANSLGMPAIIGDLRAADLDAVARRSPAYRPRVEEREPTAATMTAGPGEEQLDPMAARGDTRPNHRGRPRQAAKREFRTLRADEVVDIHMALVEDFSTTPDPIDPPGVKSADLLESAVARQFTSLGDEPKYKTLAHMAASLFYGLSLNHPFHNGNKRSALVALICLADANDMNVTASEDELYEFVLRVVNHEYRPTTPMSASAAMDREVEAIAAWIRPHLKRKEHFHRTIRWRELRACLRRLGVTDEVGGGSQIELVRDGRRTVVDFDGDTREVHPGVVRKIRKDLALTVRDECDDDVFYGDSLPLDHFIGKYRGLLRQLAYV